MSSVFDDLSTPPEPPTWAEFELKLGDPQLTFDIGSPQIALPLGALACCRVTHQPHCDLHVARSLVGCRFTITFPDGSSDRRSPVRQAFEGDVLANPRALAASVGAVHLMAVATAEAGGGQVTAMEFEVYLLNLELAEIWRYLMGELDRTTQQSLEAADDMDGLSIEVLPIGILDDPDDPDELSKLMARPDFHPVRAYASKVLVLPHEIGRTDEARYVTSPIWGADEDNVPPAIGAILADPLERDIDAPRDIDTPRDTDTLGVA